MFLCLKVNTDGIKKYFKTFLKSLMPIITLFLLYDMLCEIRDKELTMVLGGLP